ncbi:MAG: DUF3089 domain-containing protein [Pseudomonadales bacterium]|jgi:hypothetical protein|nr:DUF3089 domain-containing protein [Pseudomonadales bacterium]MDP6471081.1 DUF3089 domain-containing protein [Pseudomonadales bacterium]MDP6825733.1 DUF3089 domain-containing protein [Pseudomonadales bacterium]MDP6970704.1 DUF3089 domain-containing protein [Pseudomonadales bacterium]
MKKFLIITGVIAAVLLVLGIVFRDMLQFAVMAYTLKPGTEFAETTPPSAPDYANAEHWAALPDRDDKADVTPGEVVDNQATAAVDVFFIHPTTYYSGDGWNQPLDNAQANAITDDGVLRNQASVFNSCCRVYAPRYRQATLYSFFDQPGGGKGALELAYSDVEDSFDYYLQHYNRNRPFILAAHSQGALHLDTLLRNRINGSLLAQRMIAAYPIGYYLDGSNGIPVCTSPVDTGCQVTWNSLAPDAPVMAKGTGHICVNPLTWLNDDSRADFDLNKGAVSFDFAMADSQQPGKVESGIADAQCKDGRLIVSEIRSPNYPSIMFGEGNYHVYDYSLFHMNIRENAQMRTQAYLSAN